MKRYIKLFEGRDIEKLKILLDKLGAEYEIKQDKYEVTILLTDRASRRESDRIEHEVYTLFSDGKIGNRSISINSNYANYKR